MSDAEEEAPAAAQPLLRVRSSHTGAEFEGHFLNRNRGVHRPDVQEVDGREWSGGHSNYAQESGRRRKLADTPDTKTILVTGRGSVNVFRGSSAVASAPSSRQTTMALARSTAAP